MAGTESKSPIPTRIVVHQRSRVLELEFEDGSAHKLSFEFLRVHSPSAEVRGHGPGQEVLQVGKRDVGIERIDPVGNYAIQPRFSDGHATGIYSWDYLHRLVRDHDRLWQDYLRRLEEAGQSRDPAPAGPGGAAGISAVALSRRGKGQG
jgi:DUF971 family protein